jgi:hypothetical protein
VDNIFQSVQCMMGFVTTAMRMYLASITATSDQAQRGVPFEARKLKGFQELDTVVLALRLGLTVLSRSDEAVTVVREREPTACMTAT